MTRIFHANGQLVAQRHEERIVDAARYRQARSRRAECGPRSESARRIAAQVRAAFQTWHAAGEL